MKKIRLVLSLLLVCLLFSPVDSAYAKGTQVLVPDTVNDSHSKYTALYKSGIHHTCTAILISSTAAVTAKHCGGTKHLSPAGTIYPGASGLLTPFGYMNIRSYIPHPKYDIAVIKGTERDQDKFYKYYIKKFKTKVTGYTNKELQGFQDSDIYSYGYPYREGVFKQYRSDGQITNYSPYLPLFYTNMPGFEGQSGSGVFTKNGLFVGIITGRTHSYEADVLPLTEDIAKWINDNAE